MFNGVGMLYVGYQLVISWSSVASSLARSPFWSSPLLFNSLEKDFKRFL